MSTRGYLVKIFLPTQGTHGYISIISPPDATLESFTRLVFERVRKRKIEADAETFKLVIKDTNEEVLPSKLISSLLNKQGHLPDMSLTLKKAPSTVTKGDVVHPPRSD